MDGGEQIPQAGKPDRPIHYGDFLILVQRRSELFREIIRACKTLGLPIEAVRAGAICALDESPRGLRCLGSIPSGWSCVQITSPGRWSSTTASTA